MFDSDSKNCLLTPKQIEVNTIASSFGGVSGSYIKSVHTRALRESNRNKDISLLPNNPSTDEIARGLVEGWNAYGSPKASITFLVLEVESNIFDQRAIEYAINSINDRIPVRRRTFKEVTATSRLSNDGILFL